MEPDVMRVGRFVILEHDHPFRHWDFMIEWEGQLRTWRLHSPLSQHEQIVAEPLADHRIDYLDYEGDVSGNRGRVRREHAGDYHLLDETSDRILLVLSGTLEGRVVLVKSGKLWSFTYQSVTSGS